MKKSLVVIGSGVLGMLVGSATIGKVMRRTIDQKAKKVDKFKNYYSLLNQWLALKQQGDSLEKYFLDKGYKTIAIYGMGELGNRLYEDLKDSSIEVKYAVDQDAANTYSELEVIEKSADFADVDVMVVTATFAFNEIQKEIRTKAEFPIVSLEDVIYEI